MKKIVFALMSVAAFVACSNDEVSEANLSAIEFNPTTKNSVRTVATTTSTISKFNVWSYTNAQGSLEAKPVMENVVVSNATGVWAYSPVKYWPYDATLDFYGITPTTLVGTGNGSVEHHIDVAVNSTAAKINFAAAATSDMQGNAFVCKNYPDILYATALDLTKDDNGGTTVLMNFRHAMSQVEFKLKNTSAAATEVSYNVMTILLEGIDNKGTYTLPAASTTNEFTVAESHGTWASEMNPAIPHRFNVAEDKVAPGQTMSLTNKDNVDDMHMVIPQKKDATLKVHVGIYQGEFFIQQVVKTIPLSVDWKEGHKYTYTLLANSTSDPDLDPIDFKVTVDDMVIVDNQDVNLD